MISIYNYQTLFISTYLSVNIFLSEGHLNLHLYIYTYPLTINIPTTNNYPDFTPNPFFFFDRTQTNQDSGDKTHTKLKTICSEATKQDQLAGIGPKPDPYNPRPHQAAPGAGAFTYGAFLTMVAFSRPPYGFGLSLSLYVKLCLGFISLCSISFITCSRTLSFFHEHL